MSWERTDAASLPADGSDCRGMPSPWPLSSRLGTPRCTGQPRAANFVTRAFGVASVSRFGLGACYSPGAAELLDTAEQPRHPYRHPSGLDGEDGRIDIQMDPCMAIGSKRLHERLNHRAFRSIQTCLGARLGAASSRSSRSRLAARLARE